MLGKVQSGTCCGFVWKYQRIPSWLSRIRRANTIGLHVGHQAYIGLRYFCNVDRIWLCVLYNYNVQPTCVTVRIDLQFKIYCKQTYQPYLQSCQLSMVYGTSFEFLNVHVFTDFRTKAENIQRDMLYRMAGIAWQPALVQSGRCSGFVGKYQIIPSWFLKEQSRHSSHLISSHLISSELNRTRHGLLSRFLFWS